VRGAFPCCKGSGPWWEGGGRCSLPRCAAPRVLPCPRTVPLAAARLAGHRAEGHAWCDHGRRAGAWHGQQLVCCRWEHRKLVTYAGFPLFLCSPPLPPFLRALGRALCARWLPHRKRPLTPGTGAWVLRSNRSRLPAAACRPVWGVPAPLAAAGQEPDSELCLGAAFAVCCPG